MFRTREGLHVILWSIEARISITMVSPDVPDFDSFVPLHTMYFNLRLRKQCLVGILGTLINRNALFERIKGNLTEDMEPGCKSC
jgi:hypothetical protein